MRKDNKTTLLNDVKRFAETQSAKDIEVKREYEEKARSLELSLDFCHNDQKRARRLNGQIARLRLLAHGREDMARRLEQLARYVDEIGNAPEEDEARKIFDTLWDVAPNSSASLRRRLARVFEMVDIYVDDETIESPPVSYDEEGRARYWSSNPFVP